MKIAVMSDIHGFAPAFEAVLADLRSEQPDQLVVAGDLFEGGPSPERVLQLLREHNARCVYGNTDRDLLANGVGASDLVAWTRDRIGDAGLAFLGDLPFSLRFEHPDGGGPATDLLVVHANPTDVERHLSPNASEREIREIVGDEPARTIVFGHLHVRYVREVGEHTLIDVSAVGNPRDGDLRPRYAIVEPDDDGRWGHRFRFVPYPLEETRDQMEQSGMPGWKKALDRLQTASYNRSI